MISVSNRCYLKLEVTVHICLKLEVPLHIYFFIMVKFCYHTNDEFVFFKLHCCHLHP
jgi:hypothetical protein